MHLIAEAELSSDSSESLFHKIVVITHLCG